jgi:hypothetical protein
MTIKSASWWFTWMIVGLSFSGVGLTEGNDANKNALAKAQYMLRQLSIEKAELDKTLAKQKMEIEKLSKEITQLKAESKNKLDAAQKNQQQIVSQLKSAQQKFENQLQSENAKSTSLITTKQTLEQRLAKQVQNFDVCYDNNKKLYQINQEILAKYQDKDFWDALRQQEPVTAVEKVKVENLVQDYQYEMDQLSVKIVSDDKIN